MLEQEKAAFDRLPNDAKKVVGKTDAGGALIDYHARQWFAPRIFSFLAIQVKADKTAYIRKTVEELGIRFPDLAGENAPRLIHTRTPTVQTRWNEVRFLAENDIFVLPLKRFHIYRDWPGLLATGNDKHARRRAGNISPALPSKSLRALRSRACIEAPAPCTAMPRNIRKRLKPP